MQDHYAALGIRRTATAEEIRAAYRHQARQHHPDAGGSPEAFQAVQEAYEQLGDPEKRARYDAALSYVETVERQKEQAAASRQSASGPMMWEAEPAPPAAEPMAPSYGVKLQEMSMAVRRGNLRKAEDLAKEILHADQKVSLAHAVLGDAAKARGELEKAMKRYGMAAQYDPDGTRYLRLQQQMQTAMEDREQTASRREDRPRSGAGSLIVGFLLIGVAGALIIAMRDEAVAGPLALSHLAALALAGLAAGASLSAGDYLDRFVAQDAISKRLGPGIGLGLVTLISFWLGLILYLLVGAAQRSFSASTSRLFALCAAALLILFAFSYGRDSATAWTLLAFGGSLTYIGALLGWLAADGLRASA